MTEPVHSAGAPQATQSGLGRFAPEAPGTVDHLVDVHLLRFPLRLWRQASEHHEELMRELALLALSDEASRSNLPRRLTALVETLGRRYGRVAETSNAERDAAVERGEQTCDLTYRVPPSVRDAALALSELLEEADTFCRTGAQLLTLATPPELVEFRQWYVHEFVHQIDGGPATPWPGPV